MQCKQRPTYIETYYLVTWWASHKKEDSYRRRLPNEYLQTWNVDIKLFRDLSWYIWPLIFSFGNFLIFQVRFFFLAHDTVKGDMVSQTAYLCRLNFHSVWSNEINPHILNFMKMVDCSLIYRQHMTETYANKSVQTASIDIILIHLHSTSSECCK